MSVHRKVSSTAAAVLGIGIAATTLALEVQLPAPAAPYAGEIGYAYRLHGVQRGEEVDVLANAFAGLVLLDRGEALVLIRSPLPRPDALAPLRRAESLGLATVADLMARGEREYPGFRRGDWGRHLVMFPVSRPRGSMGSAVHARTANTARAASTVLTEGFESAPWSLWERYSSESDFMWEATSCAAHGGSFAADAVRGGSSGSALGCGDAPPLDLGTQILSACQDLTGASEAWLDLWATFQTGEDDSYFGIFYRGSEGTYSGLGFGGDTGTDWIHFVFDLTAWGELGDLTAQDCTRLMLDYEAGSAPGWGVRVDDVTVRTDARPELACTASASPLSGPAPLTVDFTGAAHGAASPSYRWWFGDGATSTAPNPTHTFVDDGEYIADFRVIDGDAACYSAATVSVGGTASLAASASAAPTSGAPPLAVQFTGSAAGGTAPYGYAWTFGDGGSSSQRSPAHTYGTAGTYTATLTVTDAASVTATDTVTVSVAEAVEGGVPPAGTYEGSTSQGADFSVTVGGDGTISSMVIGWLTYAGSHVDLPVQFGAGSRPSIDADGSFRAYSSGCALPSLGCCVYGLVGYWLQGTFTAAGDALGYLKVYDYNSVPVSCYAQEDLRFTIGSWPPLGASASVTKASGEAPLYVRFSGSAWGGTPPYSWEWDFDDGETAGTNRPGHTFDVPGTYDVTLTVTDAASREAAAEVGVNVLGDEPYVWFIPSVAHLPGAGETLWRTDAAVVNIENREANVTLVYHEGGAAQQRTAAVQPGATRKWTNILESLFGMASGASSSGSLEIRSDVDVFAASRTYTEEAGGTYGQYYPALPHMGGFEDPDEAVLPLLAKNSAFRTNVGFINLGRSTCFPEVTLHAEDGSQVGATKRFPKLFPGEWVQQYDVFADVGAGRQDVAYARLRSGEYVWAYASVVDWASGDPTTIPSLVDTGTGDAAHMYLVPAVAHLPGAGTTLWRTDLALVNTGSVATQVLVVYHEKGSTQQRSVDLPAGATRKWANVLEGLFGMASGASSSGSLEIRSDVRIHAAARTYTEEAGGTYGQYYPALAVGEGFTDGDVAVLPLLAKNADFRTNIGILNLGGASSTVRVTLHDESGAQVGSAKMLTAAAGEWTQQYDIFANVGAGSHDVAYARLEIQTPGGRAWGYASVVDWRSGDPTTIPALVHGALPAP